MSYIKDKMQNEWDKFDDDVKADKIRESVNTVEKELNVKKSYNKNQETLAKTPSFYKEDIMLVSDDSHSEINRRASETLSKRQRNIIEDSLSNCHPLYDEGNITIEVEVVFCEDDKGNRVVDAAETRKEFEDKLVCFKHTFRNTSS